jgi:hypothetical protein
MAVTASTVTVAVAAGGDAWESAQDLRGVPGIRMAASPRHATVLLVAGTIGDHDREALLRVHDQVPRPRAAVAWRPAGRAADVPAHTVSGDLDDVVSALRSAHAGIAGDPARGADDLLPDTDPHEWRGVGPFGQGGQGMMGGTPYGRPMAMTGDDRDGLALDRQDVTLGPFLDPLPGGCSLDITLQGEVLQDVSATVRPVVSDRFPQPADAAVRTVRHLLRRIAHGLHVAGLDALASRAAAMARHADDGGERLALIRDARRLVRRTYRSGVLWTLRDVGRIDGADASDRWRSRLDGLLSALDGTTHPGATSVATPVVEDVLTGMTLTDAVATLASIDAVDAQPATAVAS